MIIKSSSGEEIGIVQITRGNEPLRESHLSSQTKKVRIPNNSEYRIMIKNQLPTTMLAGVSVDGIDLGQEFVIYSMGRLHLERFLDTANKFKFVRYEGSGQEDSVRKSDAGIIEIKLRYNIQSPTYIYHWGTDASQWPWPEYTLKHNDVCRGIASDTLYSNSIAGVTVEGEHSNQEFQHVNIEQNFNYTTTARFELVVADEHKCSLDHLTLRRINQNYCSECGLKL